MRLNGWSARTRGARATGFRVGSSAFATAGRSGAYRDVAVGAMLKDERIGRITLEGLC